MFLWRGKSAWSSSSCCSSCWLLLIFFFVSSCCCCCWLFGDFVVFAVALKMWLLQDGHRKSHHVASIMVHVWERSKPLTLGPPRSMEQWRGVLSILWFLGRMSQKYLATRLRHPAVSIAIIVFSLGTGKESLHRETTRKSTPSPSRATTVLSTSGGTASRNVGLRQGC